MLEGDGASSITFSGLETGRRPGLRTPARKANEFGLRTPARKANEFGFRTQTPGA